MKMKAGLHIVIVAFLAVSSILYAKASEKEPGGIAKVEQSLETNVCWVSSAVCSYKCGDWELRVEYLNKGSRSEGQNGLLLKGGKSVVTSKKGTVISTTLGDIKYYGTERNYAWALSGWNFADRRRVKISSSVKTNKKKVSED